MQANWLTAKAVAARLGIHAPVVRYLLARGRLAGERVGRDWLIDPASVAEYQASRAGKGKPGPKGCET